MIKVNRKRRERNFIRYYGSVERVLLIKQMKCLICSAWGCDNVHVRSKAAGGTYRDIVNLCNPHHQELHRIGITTFQEKYSIDLEEEARNLFEEIGDD